MRNGFKLLTVGANGAARNDLEALLRSSLADLSPHLERGGGFAAATQRPAGSGNGGYDLIIADIREDPAAGLDFLRRLRASGSVTPVIFYACPDGVDAAVTMMREGAADCLTTGVNGAAVSRSVRRVLHLELSERARRESEIALRLSEASLRTLVERSADAILVVDPEGTILFANPAAQEMFARPADALIGQPFGFPLSDDDSTRIELVGAGGAAASADMRVVETNWQGRSAFLATLRETTERDRAEEQLRRNSALLEQMIAERTTELEAANRAKDQFLAVLSHELRTPLTPVLMAVSVLEEDPRLPPDLLQDVQMIRRNVALETRLIDDLLDLTRITRGKLQLSLDTVDVHQCVRRALAICDADVRAKSMEVTVDLAAGESFARADAARLEQVFWNLVKNAVKFTPARGRLTIRSSNPRPRRLRVEVTDTGMGIEPTVLPQLFKPFEQGGPLVTRQYGGLGLGLVISKGVVEAHGGVLSAHSAGASRGSTFAVELDVAPPAADADRALTPPERPATEGARPLRLLLVEDHEMTLKIMSRLLAKLGYSVEMASSVSAALQLLRRERFDLLISDIGLPDGTGHDLMRELRTFDPNLKGIAVSGFGMEHDVERSRAVGFTAHLTKPVDIPTLNTAIRHALERGPATRTAS